jgi:hypothetical protein
MALVKNVNAYSDVADANLYFADRLDVAAWESATVLQKEQALITATSMLDNLNWIGQIISSSQVLAFPREAAYFDPRTGTDVLLGEDVPERIIKGGLELAYHLLNNDGLLDDVGQVNDIEVGSIKLSNIRRASTLPTIVRTYINPLLIRAGARSWWRAN